MSNPWLWPKCAKLKTNSDNNTVDFLKLESKSQVLFDKTFINKDFFMIISKEDHYMIRNSEFLEIYEKLRAMQGQLPKYMLNVDKDWQKEK